MDSGLGVRWPLSPYATALAAGALFAFCIALWKHHHRKGTEKDPSGRTFAGDLDPKKEQDASNKPDKKGKSEAEAEGSSTAQNFPVLALRDLRRGINYEHLCLSGQFGAIPRTPQRNQTLENPNLYSAFRWRNVRKEKKDWQDFNSASSNFSCIYQQSPSLATELPRLNTRFFLNISPHLQSFIRQFRDVHPECSRTNEFDNFDVAIKPEILRDKPITRSAVCLALQRQLHKFIKEPFREIKLNERAIQTADISEEEDDDKGASGNAGSNERSLDADRDTYAKSDANFDSEEYSKKINLDSSIWDSGYGEKAFCERSSTPKELNKDDNNVLMEEFGDAFKTDDSEILSITKYSDLLKTDNNQFEEERDHGITYDDDLCNVSKEHNNDRSDMLEEQHGNLTSIELDGVSGNSNVISSNDVSVGTCDKLVSEADEIQDILNRDRCSEFSTEHVNELNFQPNAPDINTKESEISDEEPKNLSFEGNVDDLPQISKCSDKELGKYREEIQLSSSEENMLQNTDYASDVHTDSDIETLTCSSETRFEDAVDTQRSLSFSGSNLEQIQSTEAKSSNKSSADENLSENTSESSGGEGKNLDDPPTRAEESGVDWVRKNLENYSELERIQSEFERGNDNIALSAAALENPPAEKRRNSRVTEETEAPAAADVTEEGLSRDSAEFDERGTSNVPRQMDRETGERSVAVESTVTTETTLRDARLSTAVVSRLTLDDWAAADREDSVSVKTTVSEEIFRPGFEEFVPVKGGNNESNGNNYREKDDDPDQELLPSSPRVDRLKGLISRDEERRARAKFQHLPPRGGACMEGEWDRLLRDVLASVSELERWERRDVSGDAEEDAEQRHHFSSLQSDSSFDAMEEGEAPPCSPKGETPTKVKSLRFKLDPDVFDVPSDDSFYDDDENNYDDETRRWKKQSKYRAFSSLELGPDEPVRLVSVHASVVPAGQKMVARPVGIDLRVRLTEERQSKRAHVSTSPSQAKRRSPVSDRGIGWCQELSPVTENVDWRETFTPVTSTPECKTVPNGILKTPSPKMEPSHVESPNPFKLENGVTATTNGVTATTNGVTKTNGMTDTRRVEKPKYNGWKPPVERKPFLIIRKKFEPDPEAIERITGYKSALSKPPLPPPIPSKANANLILRNRAEMARKQYLDNKAALAASKVDGTKKFQQFLSQAQSDRARIVTSVPDLAAIERAVTEQWTKERASVSPRQSPGREDSNGIKTDGVTLSRGSTPDDKWASYVQSCRQHLSRRSQSMTYLETDIDIIPVLDGDEKCHSTSALDEPDEALPDPDDSDLEGSREDLDDSGRAKSEHELRIERSLRSLPLPDWYRRSDKTKTGFLLGSSSNKEKRGWAAAKSLASSTSSLASCGLRRPVRSLRSSRENIPWSRASASPDGPTLSLALAKAFREPYLGWRARTPTSSGVSSSPRASPPSWGATTTDDEANGVSFDGEDAFGRTTSSEDDNRRDNTEPLSLDDTGADAVTVSMDTNDPVKLPGGEDTCDDINNMSMDTCELFDVSANSVVAPVDEDPSSPRADTGDDIDNLSTDTTTTTEGRKLDPKLKRYSYSQSIYHSEWDEDGESRGDRKGKKLGEDEDRDASPPSSSSSDHKVVWIESSFVGSRTTTSIVVLPEKKAPGSTQQERPASR